MNCSHVLGLIDAGPYADYPPAHLEAAWRHARGCPTCGPARDLSTAVTRELARMHVDPPAHLATAIAARIARLEAPHRVIGETNRTRSTPATSGWWPVLSTVVGGAMAGFTFVASSPPKEWTLRRFAMMWAEMGVDPLVQPAPSGAILAMAGGLVLFVIGLFFGRGLTRRVP